jgi:3-dehydrosphinganine reductase
MKTNYIGTIYCTKCVIESMKQRKFGRILFVSSQAGQIGIYGYTAYSATKFALKGFVEALQMELKPFNIYLTLAYPPDTDTPGLKGENVGKPDETRLIAEGSGLLDSNVVALKMIQSIKSGAFSCSFGINGFLLTTLNSGCSTVTNFKDTLIEITVLPLCRLVAIIMGFYFDSIVKSSYKKKKL